MRKNPTVSYHILGLGLILILMAGCTSTEVYPSFLSSHTTYNLHIQTSAPLSNATFYIPLPVKNNIPMVGSQRLRPEDFQQPGYSVAFTTSPPANIFTGEYPVPDNHSWYIRISSDYWSNDSYRIVIVNGSGFHSPENFLETRFPLGNTSVFLPKFNFSAPEPDRNRPMIAYNPIIEYNTDNIPQTIPVYAEYFSDTETQVIIYTDLEGENSWLDGPDQWYTNSYFDSINIGLIGPQSGWYPHSKENSDGFFREARGTYPDFTDSKWQKLVNLRGDNF